MKFSLLLLLYILPFSRNAHAQITAGDTVNAELNTDTSKSKVHSPKKATIYSVILPGLGQAYNKKYWKIPIIYAGATALSYAIYWNIREFKYFNNGYVSIVDNDSSTVYTGPYDAASLKFYRDQHRRWLDLSVIGSALLYALNIIDANVDAQLYQFDVSDDLSLRIEPKISSRNSQVLYALHFQLNF